MGAHPLILMTRPQKLMSKPPLQGKILKIEIKCHFNKRFISKLAKAKNSRVGK